MADAVFKLIVGELFGGLELASTLSKKDKTASFFLAGVGGWNVITGAL
jgi:hypothetical protein